MMFYDPDFEPKQLILRYTVGQQEREVVVLANGHSLEDHVERLKSLMEWPTDTMPSHAIFVTWPLASGGAVAIRLDSIIALEAPEV